MSVCPICFQDKTIFFHKIKIYKYYFCKKCVTIFLSPPPSKKELTKYYQSNFDYKNGLINEIKIRRRSKLILKQLRKLNPHGKNLLDIGSGFGYFLDEARNFGLQTLGIEPSQYLSKTSVKNFSLKVVNCDFESYFPANKKQKFDYITLIHLIEHLPNPHKLLEKMFSLLDKNGIAYIETPNLDSHLFWAEKKSYTFLTPPDHLFLFSRYSFKQMLKRIKKIKIVKTTTYSYPEHLMGILKMIFKNIKSADTCFERPQSRTSSLRGRLGKHSVKFKIFDQFLAPLFTPLLNLRRKGSILELYLQKK